MSIAIKVKDPVTCEWMRIRSLADYLETSENVQEQIIANHWDAFLELLRGSPDVETWRIKALDKLFSAQCVGSDILADAALNILDGAQSEEEALAIVNGFLEKAKETPTLGNGEDSPDAAYVLREKVQLWEDGPYWATTNIGAEEPHESGLYFWWGDTIGYRYESNAWVANDGSSPNFSFCAENCSTYNKDVATLQSEGWVVPKDGTYVLAPEHDAAQIHWGGGWRMPTKQELDALCDMCDWTWTTMSGVNGYIVRGRGAYSDACIFLPAAGCSNESSLYIAGSYGYFWSSVPFWGNYYSWYLRFCSGYHGTNFNFYRDHGQSVRPVQGFAE